MGEMTRIVRTLEFVADEYRSDAERHRALARRFQNRILGNSRVLRRSAEKCEFAADALDTVIEVLLKEKANG